MKPSYPKDVIAAAAAQIHYIKTIDYWESKFTVPLEEYIVICGEIYDSYCYPECSEKRDQIECRLLDPTHLLTNMRCHCTEKYVENSLSSTFLEVSKSDNDILPRSIISPMIDKQLAVIAMKFFSKEVQEKMVELEEMKEYLENQKPPEDRKKVVRTSYFVKCIREWYEACNSRGLSPHTRIERLHAFDKLLRQNVDFSSFPPPGGYVKGIPIVCYEGILVNNCIHLYKFCKGRKYNSRSF